MTTREAQKLARQSVFRQQRISSSVALDGVGNSPDNKNRGAGVKSQPMNLPDDTASRAISKSLPGPDFLRYYPVHQLMAWQPQGTLDDLMLDQIADWLVSIENYLFRSRTSLISVS